MISLVLVVSLGILATMSPALILSPSETTIFAPTGKRYLATALVPGILTVLPFSSLMETRVRKLAPLYSTITFLERPVTSSTCSCIVFPSNMSPYFTVPSTSASIGMEKGSHSASRSPVFTMLPFLTLRWAPYGTGYFPRLLACSSRT